ncbi:DMT family transporter [Clostridium sp.]|uniref:DMT family transporter n=1 Tax=Clostridium sp. TaxID=1506 RepID=UPI003464A894
MEKQRKLAYISATLYAFIIGLSFLCVKVTLTVTTPLDTLAHRFTIAFIFALIPIIFRWIKLDIRVKDIVSIIPIALFYPVIFFTFQALGLVYISSSEAGIIQATLPIFTMILSRLFLKEDCSKLQKIFLFLSTLGVIYIFFMKGTSFNIASFKGASLILLSTISSAIYNILARKTTKKYKSLDLTYMIITVGFSYNHIS